MKMLAMLAIFWSMANIGNVHTHKYASYSTTVEYGEIFAFFETFFVFI